MHAEATELFHQGNACLARHDATQAEACFRRAVALAPEFGEAHANLGWLLEESGALEAAEACYRRAVALCPAHTGIRLNCAALLGRLKHYDDALAMVWGVVEELPEHAPAWSNLGAVFLQAGQPEPAEHCLRRALEIDPDYRRAHANLAYLCLQQGREAEGWQHYARRSWQADLSARVDAPRWNGEPLQGRSILLGHEGGHGDMIQFSRYASRLKQAGAGRVTLLCQAALVRLLSTLHGVDEVMAFDAPLSGKTFDLWSTPVDLPRLLGVAAGPKAMPSKGLRHPAYLHADAASVQRWQALLDLALDVHDERERGLAPALRVGLVWKGSQGFENDRERSLPSLSVLEPLGDVAGVQFVSLQKGQGCDEARDPPPALQGLIDAGPKLHDFAQTAALVQCLDLVICVDTAVAHLAGALGKACWLLLPQHLPDWRWGLGREETPWYPGAMRLFRQSGGAGWAPVVQRLHAELQRLTPSPGAFADRHASTMNPTAN